METNNSELALCYCFNGQPNLDEGKPSKKILGSQIALPEETWSTLAIGWSIGFGLAGLLNLIVAYTFSLDFWVSYKLFGGFGITLLYILITLSYLSKKGYLKEGTISDQEK